MNDRLKMIIAITERDRGAALVGQLRECGMIASMRLVGRGTATSDMLDILGLDNNEKSVVISFATEQTIDRFTSAPIFHSGSSRQTRALITVSPVNAASRLLAAVVERGAGIQNQGDKAMSEKEYKYSMVMIAAKRGFSESIMSTACRAGAKGGTLLRAGFTGAEQVENATGILIDDDREIIMILATPAERASIMEAVNAEFGLRSEAQGLLWSLPIEQAMKI